MADVARRTGLSTPVIESLATAGGFDCFGLDRSGAVVGRGWSSHEGVIGWPGLGTAPTRRMPAMTPIEQDHGRRSGQPGYRDQLPDQYLRPGWTGLGVIPAAELQHAETAAGPDRRRSDPPATPRDRQRDHLHGLGRDRADQRRLLPGVWQRHRRVAANAGHF